MGDAPAAARASPNPHHAVVTGELLGFHGFLNDGGFEQGETGVVVRRQPAEGFELAQVERTTEAARRGGYG